MDIFDFYFGRKKLCLTIIVALTRMYLTRFGIIFMCVCLNLSLFICICVCVILNEFQSEISWGLGSHCVAPFVAHVRHSLNIVEGTSEMSLQMNFRLITIFSGPSFMVLEPEGAVLYWLWGSTKNKQTKKSKNLLGRTFKEFLYERSSFW